MLDRQDSASAAVVAWFLAQESRENYRSFRSPLEELTKGKRGRNHPPWKFAPPHAERCRVTALDGEKPNLVVEIVCHFSVSHADAKPSCVDFIDHTTIPPVGAMWRSPARW